MSRKIIRPEGADLANYLEEGYKVCNMCGALMELEDLRKKPLLVCPGCGWTVELDAYEYIGYDPRLEESDNYGQSLPLVGCRACGGPYPYCKTSCPLFDE